MKKKIIVGAIIIIAIFLLSKLSNNNQSENEHMEQSNQNTEQAFSRGGLKTDTSKTVIPLDEVLGGGPSKDGIPALTNPKFVNADEATDVPNDSFGVLVQNNNETKFYPYTILVWHEIVNDEIGGKLVSVTFCPLCGSAIAYDRDIDGTIYEFGVSGKLWQSNLLMYDKKTESLWSQIEGRAVVGELVGLELTIYPSQLLSFSDAKKAHPNMLVLSSDTGFRRNYGFYPYGDYDNSDRLIFPVNNLDESISLKTLMYASVINDEPVAFIRDNLLESKTATLETKSGTITANVSENNEITVSDSSGKEYPGYVTMWFSWANHNDGPVWK